MEHVTLNIDLDSIAGIRDLQGSRAVSRRMKDGRDSWKLTDVARKLNLGSQSRIHTAIEDARLIRGIYRTIEGTWEDNSENEIALLQKRVCNTKPIIARSRLKYSTDIRKERTAEDNNKLIKESEEDEVNDSERQVIVTGKDLLIHDLTLSSELIHDLTQSPDVSIEDKIYITPPTSPMEIDTSISTAKPIKSIDTGRKGTLPGNPVGMDSSSEDELLEVRTEFHFI